MNKNEDPTLRVAFPLFLALLALVWFGSLSTRSLISPDEGRYATLSWEMLRTGDWITPRLNGILYFEKPPLQYWLGAIFMKLFGANAFAARLWPALSGFLTALMVGFTAHRLWGKEAGMRSLAIAASMTWVFGNAHFLTLDAGLTLFLTISLCAVLVARYATATPAARRGWIWLAWAAMAGAVLSKGLIGIVIPGAALVITAIWRRDLSLWRGMHWVSGLLIFFALAAPWFVLVSLRNPGFAEFFFIHEHFARYLTKVHQREGAWWYYLPFLLGGMLPWISGLPWLVKLNASPAPGRAISATDVLIAYSVFVLLFFSASGSKLPSYILPMFPAIALLLGHRLVAVPAKSLRLHLIVPVLLWAIALAAPILSARVSSNSAPPEVFAQMATGLRIGALLFLGGAALAWWWLRRNRNTLAILTLALAHVLGLAVALAAHEPFGRLKSATPYVAVLQPLIQSGAPVFSVGGYDQTLPFYLRHEVILVDYTDEFAMGQLKEPERSIQSPDEFAQRWQSLPQAAAYMDVASYVDMHRRGLPMRVLYQDQRRVVVSRQ